jgi:TctA family transporter
VIGIARRAVSIAPLEPCWLAGAFGGGLCGVMLGAQRLKIAWIPHCAAARDGDNVIDFGRGHMLAVRGAEAAARLVQQVAFAHLAPASGGTTLPGVNHQWPDLTNLPFRFRRRS